MHALTPQSPSGMQVKTFQTFTTHGPQKYALAVLGKFSGILASPDNPANGGIAELKTCRIVITTITGGPQGLTNQRWASNYLNKNITAIEVMLSARSMPLTMMISCVLKKMSGVFARQVLFTRSIGRSKTIHFHLFP